MEILSREDAEKVGSKTYYTGVPCNHGHDSYRYTVSRACSACVVARVAKWRVGNPEKLSIQRTKQKPAKRTLEQKARQASAIRTKRAANPDEFRRKDKARRAGNVEKFRQSDRDRHAKNRELRSIAAKARYIANLEENRAKRRSYYAANKAVLRAKESEKRANNPTPNRDRVKAWREANPEAKNAAHQRRRALKKGADGSHTAAEIRELQFLQKMKCAEPSCRKSIKDGYHVDHIMPLSRGGSNWIKNIQLLCAVCNCRKNNAHPIDWALRQGRLV